MPIYRLNSLRISYKKLVYCELEWQVGHFGFFLSLSFFQSMYLASKTSRWPARLSPNPIISLMASVACIEPITPTTGAATPFSAQLSVPSSAVS